MTNPLEETRHSIGGNFPPSDIEAFGERAKEKYPEVIAFAERLLSDEKKIPDEVLDDIKSGALGDYIKQLKSADKSINGAREEEKEVYLKGSRAVDGFFNSYREKLKAAIKKAADVQAVYLQKKEDSERRIREEKAEALKKKAEAELAESRRKEAEAIAAREEQAREAKRVADEAAARQKEIEDKAAAEKAAQQKIIDDLRKANEDAARVDAETKRRLKEAEAQLKDINKAEREELREVRAETRQEEQAVADLGRVATLAERESNKLLDSAVRADRQAEKMDKLAEASPADLARTRGLEGSVSTIRTDWAGTLQSRADLDLEALRPYFREDDLQFAIDQFVKANDGRKLKGAYVREETKAIIR